MNIFNKIIALALVVAISVPVVFSFMPAPVAHADFSSCAAAYSSQLGITLGLETQTAFLGVPVAAIGQVISQGIQAGSGVSSFFQNCIEHALALSIGKMLLDQMTNSIVTYINSGFQGSPTFVTNPGQYFQNIGDQVAGQFIQGLVSGASGINICSPFQLQVQTALLANFGYSVPSVSLGIGGLSNSGGDIYNQPSQSCSLSQIVGNTSGALTNAYSQFTSWQNFLAISLNDDSNPYGAYLDAESKLESEINTQTSLATQQLNWGNGFLSLQSCTRPDGSTYTKLGGNGASASVSNVTSGSVISGGSEPASPGTPNTGIPGSSETVAIGQTGQTNQTGGQLSTNNIAAVGAATNNDPFSGQAAINSTAVQQASQQGLQTPTLIGSSGTNSGSDNCQITTPGTTIAGVLQTQLGIPADQLGVADDLDKIFNSLFVQLVKQGLGAVGLGPGGLIGASSGNNYTNGRSLLSELQAEAEASSTAAQAQAQSEETAVETQIQQSSQGSSNPSQNDLALGATVTASPGTVSGNAASTLVDGNTQQTDTAGASQSFYGAITSGNSTKNSFTIDLGENKDNLYKIVVYPRNPTNPEGYDESWYVANGNKPPTFKVEILDENSNPVWDSVAAGNPAFSTFSASPYTITVNPTVSGQYVVIQGIDNGALQLAEVQVYQDTGPTITPNGDSSIVASAGESLEQADTGATATDANGASLEVLPSYSGANGAVDASTVIESGETYTITYSATDSFGISGTATRTVMGE